jgi:hypothetical protein
MHNEFAKRIDERMASHLEAHETERNIMCSKLEKLESKTDKLFVRLNIMFGGAGALWLVVQVVYMYLSAVKK